MSPGKHESYLSKHRFFKDFDRSYLKVLADHAVEKGFRRGERVSAQDDVASSFFLILEGEMEVQIPSIYGPPIVVQTLAKDDILGWSWLIPPYKWHFEAKASEDTRVLEFNGEDLRARCEEDPKMGYELMKHFAGLMADRVQAARMRVLEVCGPAEAV
jgi:CRP-like cAMP-binding protein